MKSAIFSDCGKYRYKLSRTWDLSLPRASIIMLNPSIADDKEDDPTIKSLKRIINFNGFGGFDVYNLWAIISTDPSLLKKIGHEEAMGENWIHLRGISQEETVVFAWGTPGKFGTSYVAHFIDNAYCLGLNKDGSPKHPLYLKADTKLQKYIKDI